MCVCARYIHIDLYIEDLLFFLKIFFVFLNRRFEYLMRSYFNDVDVDAIPNFNRLMYQ